MFGLAQLWAKRQPGGATAALLINHGPQPLSRYAIALSKLNLTAASYVVRDIWGRKDVGNATKELEFAPVKPFDSAFVLLTPAG